MSLTLIGLDETVGFLDPARKQSPERFRLLQNVPNPFNPSTRIDYSVRHVGPIQIVIFDILGHHIRTLVDGNQTAGEYTVIWDGTDETGHPVPSGLYFYALRGETSTLLTRKTILLR